MEIEDEDSYIVYIGFNESYSRICVGTRTGFILYKVDPFDKIFSRDDGGCSIVNVVDDSTLVAVAGSGDHPSNSRRIVRLIGTGIEKVICRLAFETPVLAIKINSKRMVIVIESEIHIFQMPNAKFLTKITTGPNPRGLIGFNTRTKTISYPLVSSQRGELIIYNLTSLCLISMKQEVHNHPLTNIQINPEGTYIATSSEPGTLIKITPVGDEEEKFSFRRGRVTGADITSISFNKDSSLLAVASTNGTVHIFKIEEKPQNTTKSYSNMFNDYVFGDETRSFATVRLQQGKKNFSSIFRRFFKNFHNTRWKVFTMVSGRKKTTIKVGDFLLSWVTIPFNVSS